MNLTDVKLTDQVSRHEIDGHEIGRQDIYRLKINYNTMQCAIFLNYGRTQVTIVVIYSYV